MKTIGLIGGMSWESTVTYYQIINETVKKELGGLHSAKILLCSVDFYEIEQCQAAGDWDRSAGILTAAAESLERAGADFLVICTNTMHKVVPQIRTRINIPILHIADATARELLEKQVQTVLLLGTKYTMTQDFYKQRLSDAGFAVIVPEQKEIEEVNRVIYEELCMGHILDNSRQYYLKLIEKYADKGAKGVILGCTEIGLLVNQQNTRCPVFDTTLIHARTAARLAIRPEEAVVAATGGSLNVKNLRHYN